ncbi:hypothetical protein MRX96_056132 [Rhipicephalus microplus]
MRQRRASGPQVRSRRHLCFCASRRVVFRPAHVGGGGWLRWPRGATKCGGTTATRFKASHGRTTTVESGRRSSELSGRLHRVRVD